MEKNLSVIQKETIKRLYKQDSYLTILLSIDEIFSNIHLYGYKNWFEGEILEGPNLDKYWIELKLLFNYNEKPSLDGARVLIKHGIKVKYTESYMLIPRKIESCDDFQDGTKKPKLDKHKIWVINLKIPKNIITLNDTFDIDDKIAQDIVLQSYNKNNDKANEEDIDSIMND